MSFLEYRWTKHQVNALLYDIDGFEPIVIPDSLEKSWYCLQPLVVKIMTEQEKCNCELPISEIWYEVIDGQQRLTTIFLIIHYFNEMWIGKQKIEEPKIKYETRSSSSDFLKALCVGDDDLVQEDNSNIDFYHIAKAYRAIHKWVKKKNGEVFDSNLFQSKFKESTKVIWYEVNNSVDSIKIFTRLNMGKIPLTNAELIKALLLSKSSLNTLNTEELRLKQLEIASEWDLIEHQLNNPDFWAFLTNDSNKAYPTKIELLLELAVGKRSKNNEFVIFDEFFKYSQEQNLKQLWDDKVVTIFEIVKEWYNNKNLYHYIGYLISEQGNIINDLLEQSKILTKSDFIQYLEGRIKDTLRSIDIHSINYNDHRTQLNTILTLFNILTIKDSLQRYPFFIHKEKSWSLEHIHAQNSDKLNKKEQWERWLRDHLIELAKLTSFDVSGLMKEIEKSLLLNEKEFTKELFDDLASKVIKVFSELGGQNESMHSLENMALIDVSDNTALSNYVFAAKRSKIIEMDKHGRYIPICTKNIFLKYYNPEATDFSYWGKTDRETYLANIEKVLKDYLPTNAPQ